MGGLFGRSVGSRIGTPSVGYPDVQVYLFTHETLRLVAQQQYGASLAVYQDRLHTWADSYRQRDWPADTPHYLLRSYPRMLASNGDLIRLVACATDQSRHDRMRDLTGGDALAFTEISTAQQLILVQPAPDLISLVLLADQREYLTDRNSGIPAELPAVWAILGQHSRAEALANSIPDPYLRAWALSRLVEIAIKSNDRDRTAHLVSTVDAVTVTIVDPGGRAQVLGRLAVVMANDGNRDRAARLADEVVELLPQITNYVERDGALSQLAEAAAVDDDYGWAETCSAQIIYPEIRAAVLGRLAVLAANGGDRNRASRLIGEAEGLIPQNTNPQLKDSALSQLVEALASVGDQERAEILITQIADPGVRAQILIELVAATSKDGEPNQPVCLADEVENLIKQATHIESWVMALSRLAEMITLCGDLRRIDHLVTEIDVLILQDSDPYWRACSLGRLAETVVLRGDQSRAARLVNKAHSLTTRISLPYERADALVQLAEGSYSVRSVVAAWVG